MIRYMNVELKEERLHLTYETDTDDGTTIGIIVMPPEILSIRAGEYGYHPVDDYETVLSIILAEAHGADTQVAGALPILVTADTLEEARAQKLDEHKRVFADRKLDKDNKKHKATLEALSKAFIVDPQIALLYRQSTKSAVLGIKKVRQRTEVVVPPVDRLRRKLIDDFRRREGV